jgi:predicted dehydrogenase/threonine dehydrogenase-like Zn-dependent dehydrogenase
MKQVLQNLRTGSVEVEEVPPPALRAPGVLVATACSLISPGTERATVELGRSSLLGKALRRPDQVRKVLDHWRREGLRQTYHKVQQRLDVTRPLGYSCAGIVLETLETSHVRAGDRVACAGADAATHAEINFVPRNLCVAIPERVGFDEAAFAALGAIALHAVRLGSAAIGETAAVLGLGPVGLLLAQILRAAGCRVAGFDLRNDRLERARTLGIAWVASAATPLDETLLAWNLRHGFDAVYIAAASRSEEPVMTAVAAVRDRGRIVVVGDVPTDFPRAACYAKELSIVYARSYGPGRYDPAYEQRGQDYPRAFVPWTAGRNLEAFLELVARGDVAVAPLISHRLPIEQAERAYQIVIGSEPSLGVLLTYPLAEKPASATVVLRAAGASAGARHIGFIGAGSYASSYLLPALKARKDVALVSLCTSRGATARKAAEQFGFARCTTEPEEILRDPDIGAVFIATRHDSHASLCARALAAGKSIFVEKPLCLTEEELAGIQAAWDRSAGARMIGFNRRYAPATAAVMDFFARSGAVGSGPLAIHYAVHAGPLPEGHWLHDPAHGGRIRGEVCHFVDWCCWMAAAPLLKLFAVIRGSVPDQSLHAVLDFADGSVAAILYDPTASRALPKEIVEVSAGGRTAILEDFAAVTFHEPKGTRAVRCKGKGQTEMLAAFLAPAAPPVALGFAAWSASSLATLKLLESAATGLPVWFDPPLPASR